jgi:hypothetical protein
MIEEFRGRVSCSTLITVLLGFDPNLTLDDLQSHLDELGLTPTRIALYSLQRIFLQAPRIPSRRGVLIERTPRAMTRSTQLKQLGAT